MSLEAATFVADLVSTNPGATDPKAQGDDHLRLIKAALQASFPNSSRAFYIPTSVAAATGTVTVAASDQGQVIPVSASGASRTVNLPANSGIPDGFEVTVFKTDNSANTVTVDADGSDTINGALTYVLTKQYQGVRLIWLDTFAAWIGLPWISAIPYFSGGQDIALTDIAPSANAKRILAATTATDWSEHTAAAVLEFISASMARGDLLMRGASAFDRLGAGTIGYLLKSGGAAADLVWGTGPARAYVEYDANTNLSTTIPFDNTIPQNTEGTEILSASITLSHASNRVRISFSGMGTISSSSAAIAVALFQDSTVNAIYAIGADPNHTDVSGATRAKFMSFEFEHAPGTAGPITYAIRVGASTGNLRMNGSDSSRFFGGVAKTTMILQEVLV